ncbi:hypothetical protein ACOMHN_008339 [Nucella lapillus]
MVRKATGGGCTWSPGVGTPGVGQRRKRTSLPPGTALMADHPPCLSLAGHSPHTASPILHLLLGIRADGLADAVVVE